MKYSNKKNKRTPTVGDLIVSHPNGHDRKFSEAYWLGLILDMDLHHFRVLVLRNPDYPNQVGNVCRWTNHEEWLLYEEIEKDLA